ncbi:MAG TPA: hypothetical protein VNO84_07690 [Burkholderiaceae bacterium]|nr:hypothetical protein [Burkholderiaceae bacterium]
MPVMQLQVEIDSDVYPELYARLQAIERPEARAERLRQLGATGLVWETMRLHTAPQAVSAPPRPAPPPLHQVPVLLDVVEEGPGLRGAAPSGTTPDPDAEDAPPLPPPLAGGLVRPGNRSARLKRMVDRGLFRNG